MRCDNFAFWLMCTISGAEFYAESRNETERDEMNEKMVQKKATGKKEKKSNREN